MDKPRVLIVGDVLLDADETKPSSAFDEDKPWDFEVAYIVQWLEGGGCHVKVEPSVLCFVQKASEYSGWTVFPLWRGGSSRNRTAIVPAVCEEIGLPYVGGDAYVQTVCQDKSLSKALIRKAGFNTPKEVVLRSVNERSAFMPSEVMLAELGRVAALCSDASLREHDGEWTVEGDPMEGALLAFAGKTGVDWRDERSTWPRTDTIPFDAKHRFMATLNHDHEGHAFVFVKGAPERIIAMCREQRSAAGGGQTLEEGSWHEIADRIPSQGQRVLALASRSVLPEDTVLEHAEVEGSLTLLGLVGLIDPPRSEAIAAVGECHSAGIRVKMITGDHAGTARAIARQIGLQNPEKVLTGVDLDVMDDPRLAAAVLETDVFARTSPEHKLRLVKAVQANKQICAMTGDGVNDAPSLKQAVIGVAMGIPQRRRAVTRRPRSGRRGPDRAPSAGAPCRPAC